MANLPKPQMSRIWHRQYTHPRDARSTFLPGWHLVTRWDNVSRWLLYWPTDPDAQPLHEPVLSPRLPVATRRVIRDLVVVIVVVALITLFGGV